MKFKYFLWIFVIPARDFFYDFRVFSKFFITKSNSLKFLHWKKSEYLILLRNDISFENMKRAVIHGSAMASFCVEKFGVEKLINITQKDIEKRVQEFIKLIKIQT